MTDASLETMDSLPLEFLQLPRSDEAAIDEATLSEPSQVFVCQATSSRPRLYYRGRILGESRGISIGPLGENNNIKSLKERLRMTVLRKDDEPMSTVLSPHVQVSPSSPKTERSDRPVNVPGHPVMHSKVEVPCHTPSDGSSEVSVNPVCFATHTTFGVLDLGASKTVIGSDHVKSLICSLDQPLRERLTRCKCQITFRFGNQGTLTSNQAIVVPIGNLLLKIAVVPGSTPFLISNTLMRALQAQIDCQAFLLRSPKLQQPVRMELTNKGLFLIDLNELARASNCPVNEHPAAKTVGETFTATACKREIPAESDSDCKGSRGSPVSSPMQCLSESQGLNQEIRACSVMPDVQDFNSHAAVGDSPAKAQHTSDCVKTEHQDPKSHVPESALEGFADEVRTKPIRCSSSEHPRPREREGGLREEKLRPQLHGGVEHRPGVGSIHGRPLQQEPQSHRKFLRFVELMVQHHEEQQMPVVVQTGLGSTEGSGRVVNPPRAKANVKFQPKAKAGVAPNSGYQEPTHFPLLDEELQEEIEMYNSLTMVPSPLSQSPEFSAMQERLLNLENALTKVVNHLETQAMEQASQNQGTQ